MTLASGVLVVPWLTPLQVGAAPNPYKHLLSTDRTTSAVFVAPTGGSGEDHSHTINLDGRVWQNDPDQSYVSVLEAPPSGGVDIGGVPGIDVPQFIIDHAPFAQPATAVGGGWQVYADGIGYFITTYADPFTGDFGLRTLSAATISVRDTVVWMFPKGLRFDGLVTVTAANPGACLIIVANRNGTFADAYADFFDTACWFFGGLQSSTVPVIMATNDAIRLEQFNSAHVNTDVSYASIYAGSIYLMGPVSTGYHMRLHHTVPEESDVLIDRLTAVGALPMPGSGPTPTRPGTWGGLKALYRDSGPAGNGGRP